MKPNNLSISNSENSERQDIRRFLLHFSVFIIPFLIYGTFIAVIDPFNFLGNNSFIGRDIKLQTAYPLNPCFWKMNEFTKNLQENILLGDSRMLAMKAELIKEAAGEDYYNFAYGGASLREDIDTFWFVTEKIKPKKVYFGINLNIYNDYEMNNRIAEYRAVKENPMLYFVNRSVWESSIYAAYSKITGEDLKIGSPKVDKDKFWIEQQELTSNYYRKYIYPENYKKELQKISEYCQKNGIELTFVIFPTHIDSQKLVEKFNLNRENEQMRKDLASFGTLLDFDYENELTADREKFKDPVHLDTESNKELIKEIWGKTRKLHY
jgi:hypothetical protein